MATITVTNGNDSGMGSLRDAIAAALSGFAKEREIISNSK